MKIDVQLLDLVFYLFSTKFIMSAVVGIFPFAVWALILAIKAHQGKVTTGKDGLVGLTGTALTKISPSGGKIEVRGEIWNAVSKDVIKKSAGITVEGIKSMVLIVTERQGNLIS